MIENHMLTPPYEPEPEIDEDQAYEEIRQQDIDDRKDDLNDVISDICGGLDKTPWFFREQA